MPVPLFCGGKHWIEAVNRAHGAVTNMNPATAWVACDKLPGYALLCDGIGYVNLGDHDLWTPGSQGFSVSLWARLDAASGSGRELIGKYEEGGREWAFAHRAGSPYQLRFFAFDLSAWAYRGRTAEDDSPQDDGEWHHFVGTYDGGTSCSGFAIYVDARRIDTADYQSGSFTGVENTGADLQIGQCPAWGGSPWLGPITDVRIYRRPLRSGEVDAINEDAVRGFPKSLNRLMTRQLPKPSVTVTLPTVIRRGPAEAPSYIRRAPSEAETPVRRGPTEADSVIRRPGEETTRIVYGEP